MKRTAAVTCWAAIVIFCDVTASAQTAPAPAFDVASIRPADPSQGEGDRHQHRIHTSPGNVVMRNVGLDQAVMWAYNVEFYQFSGPSWMETARFDITAKAAGPADVDAMRLMMQNLLSTRFDVAVHHEKREISGMALLVGKDGSKLKPSESQGESEFNGSGNGKPMVTLSRMTMHEFATLLSEPLKKPVIDFTGISGTFDIRLDATNYAPAPGEREDDGYMVLRAIQDQLGLKLEARKMSIDTVVVDRAQKTPTEN
ncbi:MAG TPA: TIGR03435 family protein [Bryobacteraceae bacterium]|jgi:uncharacterized protein (TIGR03435 family)|nr:TIGR03435 family protein [Bryobacteraceae bacterium]